MDNESEPRAGAAALPPPKNGKREVEDADEDEKQVIAKKRKRDEVGEEQKHKEEINSDYSQHDKTPEAEKSEPATNCGSLESLDDGNSGSDSDRSSDEGVMDIGEGDSSEQSDEEAQKKEMEVLMTAASDVEKPELKTVKMDTSSDTDSSDDDIDKDDDDHDSSDDIEKQHMVIKPVKDSEILEYSEEEIEEKASKSPLESPKTPATVTEKNAASKIICVRNLSYSVERADMENLFKDCGEVVDVRLNTDREGRFKGFGHVEFGTAEAAQKALELNNTELLRRPIRVLIARERGECALNRSSFHKDGRFQSQTVFVKGFDTSLVENKVKDMEMFHAASIERKEPKTPTTPNERNAASKTIYVRNLSYSVEQADMENLFKDCGEIVDVRLHTDREGRFKGFGHVEFATAEAAQKALELDNTELLRRPIIVGIAREKGEYTPNRSSFHNSERFQSQTVSVKCFDTSLAEDKFTCAEEVKDMEMFDAASVEKKVVNPETPATRKEKYAASKTICVRNLSYNVERAAMENLFKDCGEIVDVRFHMDREGRFKGFGHVEFATAEAAENALELDNTELLKRPIKVDIAQEKVKRFQSQTVFVKGFDTSLAEDKLTCVKEVKDVEMFDAASIEKKVPETPATQKETNATSKTIYVRNLSYGVERADMENLFKDCGEIVDVRLHMDREGRFKGFGHVEFATAEAAEKALELDYTELLNRPIKVGIAREKGEYIPNRSYLSNSFQKGERFQSLTVYVNGFDTTLAEEKIKSSLAEHFISCGEITRISIPIFRDSGAVKGFAHLEFKDFDSFNKALQLNQTDLGGYQLSVEKAKPRRDNQGIGGGGYQFGGRDGGDHGGRVGWGRSGGGYQFGGRDGGDHGGRVDWGRSSGGYQFGGRDVGDRDHGGRVGWGRSGGGYRFGGRDGGDHGGRVGWGRSGGGYQFGGTDGGDHGGRVGWGRSGGGWRHWMDTQYI